MKYFHNIDALQSLRIADLELRCDIRREIEEKRIRFLNSKIGMVSIYHHVIVHRKDAKSAKGLFFRK